MPERALLLALLCLFLCLASGCGVQVHPKGQIVTGVGIGG